MDKFFDGLVVFGLGMGIIFIGIAVLILFVVLQKYLVAAIEKTPNKNSNVVDIHKVNEENFNQQSSDDISDSVRVAIIAAISAYYQNNSSCEFTVKRIKRLG